MMIPLDAVSELAAFSAAVALGVVAEEEYYALRVRQLGVGEEVLRLVRGTAEMVRDRVGLSVAGVGGKGCGDCSCGSGGCR
ncbi:MAG: hypothetical protein RI897_271 [Verrucomicrobiota bacterium]|jgi:hypothetical protein